MTEEEIEIARIFSGNKYLQEYAVGYKKAKEDIREQAKLLGLTDYPRDIYLKKE